MTEFEPFPKIPRYKRGMTITEKIDGTNASIWINPVGTNVGLDHPSLIASYDGMTVLAGSRKRFVLPEGQGPKGCDNFGFAAWVQLNADELVKLGEGRHYGEWWGKGIQRGYNQETKRFSLFNTSRPIGTLPDCVGMVPVLYTGDYDNLPDVDTIMQELKEYGSKVAPGYDKPEGIVIYQQAARQLYKITFDHDKGKWSEDNG